MIFDHLSASLVACGMARWVSVILANVLRNAAAYGPADQAIRITTQRQGPRVVISVEDGGPALSAGEYEQMFEAFYRGPRGERLATGAGLGLTVARRLARAQGGSIVAGPGVAGSGTSFTIALPAAPDG